MFNDPSKSVLQMVQMLRMLAKAVANLTNVLRMKREHETWVTKLHNVSLCLISDRPCPISVFSFKVVLIVHIRPAFYGNVNTNASESLQTFYDHYKCLAINKNG